MNSSILRNAAATAVVSLACGGALAATNILTNGDFEQNLGVPNGGYQTVDTGQNTIVGWSVTGSVDLIRNAYGAINNVSVDLAGTPGGPGALTQSFAAMAGYTYRLEWDYFKNGGFGTLAVSVGSQSVNITSEPGSTVNQFLTFTAPTTDSYLVSFSTANTGSGGPVVDNIALTVTAVPEPAEWAMMMAGLGVIGVIAARRRRV